MGPTVNAFSSPECSMRNIIGEGNGVKKDFGLRGEDGLDIWYGVEGEMQHKHRDEAGEKRRRRRSN
uniref:Uncharacterized protein n=1 Tax=Pristionchus pacificus TaxID=54126 RepID=A0A2A6BCS1_PRIPA|eukprot:PDM63664.1 hypothetical protein PRIPAC_49637 [Pristionchus pacificus]